MSNLTVSDLVTLSECTGQTAPRMGLCSRIPPKLSTVPEKHEGTMPTLGTLWKLMGSSNSVNLKPNDS